MIPSNNVVLNTTINIKNQPSKQHKMIFDSNRIIGTCEDLEAMKQVIFKILNTERYVYCIYPWDYGIQLSDLYGKPVPFVCSEAQRRITEALEQDGRISSVDGFEFDTSRKHNLLVSFTVKTIYGNVKEEQVVNY